MLGLNVMEACTKVENVLHREQIRSKILPQFRQFLVIFQIFLLEKQNKRFTNVAERSVMRSSIPICLYASGEILYSRKSPSA